MFTSVMLSILSFSPMQGVDNLQPLQGTWVIESGEYSGQGFSDQSQMMPYRQVVLAVTGDQLGVYFKQYRLCQCKITVGANRSPREVDLVVIGDKAIKGIFFIDGEFMTVCLQLDVDNKRPSVFNSNGSRLAMLTLTRVPPRKNEDR